MRLIPGIPSTLVAIKRMEEGNDNLLNSANLCWMFCNSDFTLERFKERIAFEFDNIQQKRGEYLDPEITSLIIEGSQKPEKVASVLAKRLDALVQKYQMPYIGEIDDPVKVFISIHLKAAQLASIIENEGFSVNTREILEHSLNDLSRCEYALEVKETIPWPDYLAVSLKAVGCFLILTRFSIEKQDGDYETALCTFMQAVDRFFDMKTAYHAVQLKDFTQLRAHSTNVKLKTPEGITDHNYLVHAIKSALSSMASSIFSDFVSPFTMNQGPPWLRTLTFQAPVDCFEAIRAKARVQDSKKLASECRIFIEKCQEDPPILFGSNIVKDSTGKDWESDIYWYLSLGWTEASLTPSDLQESLQLGEDVAAEKRMRVYFFDEMLWTALPKRTRSSLINADRDYFSGPNARKESVLNELKVATEEILLQSVWKPLNRWILENDERRSQSHDFLTLNEKLKRKGHSPTLIDFEKICRMDITSRFLSINGFSKKDLKWFSTELAKDLMSLRKVRNATEHKSTEHTNDILSKHFNLFLGIGEPGVLVQLARLLYR